MQYRSSEIILLNIHVKFIDYLLRKKGKYTICYSMNISGIMVHIGDMTLHTNIEIAPMNQFQEQIIAQL